MLKVHNKNKLSLILGLFLLTANLMISAYGQKQLFITIGPPNIEKLPEHAMAAQRVRINKRALSDPELLIDLFGEEYLAIRDRVELFKGSRVWVGHLEGNPLGTVIITVHGNSLSALIQNHDRVYQLAVEKNRSYSLVEVDATVFPEEKCDLVENENVEYDPIDAPDVGAEGNIVLDLLVVYTEEARDQVGGSSQLEADIMTAVADMNNAYLQSDVYISINIAAMVLTEYSNKSFGDALYHLKGTTDGYMDEIHQIRDEKGADLVALIFTGTQYCGMGYVNGAFSVTARNCMIGNRSLAHEIGHNQGARHDRAQYDGGIADAYCYGYRRCNNGTLEDLGAPDFRTIMSYSCSGAPRVGIFSTPNRNYLGVPQGVDPEEYPAYGAWNARTLNESAARIANYRETAISLPPEAPSDLSAVAASSEVINLAWEDNADNEVGFSIEMSFDNLPWSSIASLGPNTTNFSQNGLASETMYYFRVSAYNSVGSSAPTMVASAKTLEIPIHLPPEAPSDLSAVTASSDVINLAWEDNADNEAGFSVEMSLDNLTWSSIASLGANTTSFTQNELASETMYYFRVSAYNSAGSSATTIVASAKTLKQSTIPMAPVNLVAMNGANGKALLTWVDASGNEDGFEIQRERQHKNKRWISLNTIASLSANSTSYIDQSWNGIFRYRIRSYNAVGSSSWSDWSFVTVTGRRKKGKKKN